MGVSGTIKRVTRKWHYDAVYDIGERVVRYAGFFDVVWSWSGTGYVYCTIKPSFAPSIDVRFRDCGITWHSLFEASKVCRKVWYEHTDEWAKSEASRLCEADSA